MVPDSVLPLAGVRVLDLGHYIAGPLVGMLCADQGADVIHIEPPGGPRWDHPATAILDRGKRVMRLDLKTRAGRAATLALAASADVLVENFRPGVLERLELGPGELHARNPRLVHVSLPGFPSRDRRRRTWRGWEGVIAAATGHLFDTSYRKQLVDGTPVYTALPVASIYAALHAATATALALRRMLRLGLGARVEVPLLTAAASPLGYMGLKLEPLPPRFRFLGCVPAEELPGLHELRRRGQSDQVRAVWERYESPFFGNQACADGRLLFLSIGDSMRHVDRLIDHFHLRSELLARGFVFACPYRDETAATTGRNLYDCLRLSDERRIHLRTRLASIFATKPAEQWERELGDIGIPCAVQRTTLEFVRSSAAKDGGLVCEVDLPTGGRMLQPAPLVDLASAGSAYRSPIEGAVPVDGAWWSAATRIWEPVRASRSADGSALEDVKVLDLTNVISGPACGRTLAEYGADVVKIDPPQPTLSPSSSVLVGIDVNRGKRSVLVDLASGRGQAVLTAQLASTDVVIYNGPDESLESLGITPARLHDVNPRTILCQITAWGGLAAGRHSGYRGYDEVLQAATGAQTRFGSCADPVVHGFASLADYSTGYAAAFATALALYRREITSEGDHARVSLARGAMYMQLPFMHDGASRQQPAEPSGQDATGEHALYRIYCAADCWLFLAEPDGAHCRPELIPELAHVLGARSATHWEEHLNARGIAAHRVVTLDELRSETARAARTSELDAPLDEAGVLFLRFDHPLGGPVEQLAPTWVQSESLPMRMGAPAPRHGLHSRVVLEELGFAPADIDGLVRDGVVSEGWMEDGSYLPA